MPSTHNGHRFSSTLITGGKGMLAHALIAALRSREVGPHSVDLPDCDITQPQHVHELFDRYRPTLLVNCAAYTNVDGCEDNVETANIVNGTAVGLLAEAAKAHGTKLVHISTDFVFDGTATRPYRPDDAPNPLSAYGRSKLLGEQNLQYINPPDWIITRTAWLYGTHGKCFPRTMVELARAGKPLRVVDDQIGSPTHTVDLADALLRLVDHDAAGIWHLVNGGTTSWYGFTQAILEEFSVTTDLGPQSSADYRKLKPHSAHRPAYSVLETAPYAKLTGQPLRPWRDALADYRAHVECAGF